MRPTKKPLALNRETIRQLTQPELSGAKAAIQIRTPVCFSTNCPTLSCPTQQHSCFDSCANSDCCLEVP